MAAPTKLFLTKNPICNTWVVVDIEDFAFGDGETPDDAIKSARIVSNAPIETYWGVVPANETALPEVEE